MEAFETMWLRWSLRWNHIIIDYFCVIHICLKSTNMISLLGYESTMNVSPPLCWMLRPEYISVFARITTNQESIPSEEYGWSISHWMRTWYFKERLHGIVCPSIVLVVLCCFEVVFLLCGQLITIMIPVFALRTYGAISNPISKILTNGNLKQLSLGFALYYFSYYVIFQSGCHRSLALLICKGFPNLRSGGFFPVNGWRAVKNKERLITG